MSGRWLPYREDVVWPGGITLKAMGYRYVPTPPLSVTLEALATECQTLRGMLGAGWFTHNVTAPDPAQERVDALRESFRRVRVDREITRCLTESGRVLMGYEWESYG